VSLTLCGLGARVPAETTVESLQALAACRVVYSDLEDAEARAWLAGYCRLQDAAPSATEVVRDASAQGGVGLAVWGNAQTSSRLAREVELLAQKAGLPYRVYAGVSPMGSAFARSKTFLGGDFGCRGIQSYDLDAYLADPKAATAKLPLVLHSERGGPARWKDALDVLAGVYPPGHEALLFHPRGQERGALTALRPSARCVVLVLPDARAEAP
jgi:hypothetical protein